MRIKSHASWMFAGMAAAGVLTLGIMGTYIYLMRQDDRDVWYFYLFVTPFVLVGSLLAHFGLRTVLRLALFGSWQIEVPDQGGVFGQPLEAVLFPTRRERAPSGPLTCHLRCIRIIRRAYNDGSTGPTDVKVLWETTWSISTALIHPSLGLPLTLPLPDGGEPTNIDRRTGSGFQWQLNVLIPLKGRSEEPVFDLPIRR